MAKRHAAGESQRSVVARIEEIVLASSGADAFELVLALVAARLVDPKARTRKAITRAVGAAEKRLGVEATRTIDVSDAVLAEVNALVDRALGDGDAFDALDAVFEQLATRVGKGDKGQFFTPRHVVDWMARMVGVKSGERVLDPACGSGAFLAHARMQAKGALAFGFDVDARAVRVARLLAAASGGDAKRIKRADALAREGAPFEADVILTNPPFAGDAEYPRYEVAALGRAERDALFVERCLEMLPPGGRLAIVLPHNKVAARSWRTLRAWLVDRARVYAVVSLPRETFLPHTSQKTAVLFAKKRERGERADPREAVLFAVSERAGKDAAGEPIFREGARARSWRAIDHDLSAIEAPLAAHLTRQKFAKLERPTAAAEGERAAHVVTRALGDLGEEVTLAPERHHTATLVAVDGVPLGKLVVDRAERVAGEALAEAIVLDTTHARDGVLDVAAAARATTPPSSAKKRVRVGDLLVSRLRPYLPPDRARHPGGRARVPRAHPRVLDRVLRARFARRREHRVPPLVAPGRGGAGRARGGARRWSPSARAARDPARAARGARAGRGARESVGRSGARARGSLPGDGSGARGDRVRAGADADTPAGADAGARLG